MNNKLPKEYLEKMKEILKDEYDVYLDSFNNNRSYALRVNTLKISVEDFLKIMPYDLVRIPWISNGFFYKEEDKLSKHPYFYAGLYYLQDPSAMTPANVLEINDGDVVLDACAAPGGKSTELGAKLKNTGLLIANDISSSRCQALIKNIENFGIENSYVISEDIAKLTNRFNNYFDKILIDAPCSGEGMFRKEPSIINDWLKRGPKYYADIQRKILEDAVKMLKDGGMMVYSTCTFDTSEDEEVIKELLVGHQELSLVDLNYYEGFKSGLLGLDECIRLYPHRLNGEGHFTCLIKKEGDKQKNIKHFKATLPNNEIIKDFFELINKEFNDGYFKIQNDKLYFIPDIDIDLKGIRVIRSGLLLGEIKKYNFEPSQALALALKKTDFKNTINFNLSDNRVISYLKGETLNIADIKHNDGYNLVLVDNYPLGWAKVNNNVLKNKYAKGWIYR